MMKKKVWGSYQPYLIFVTKFQKWGISATSREATLTLCKFVAWVPAEKKRECGLRHHGIAKGGQKLIIWSDPSQPLLTMSVFFVHPSSKQAHHPIGISKHKHLPHLDASSIVLPSFAIFVQCLTKFSMMCCLIIPEPQIGLSRCILRSSLYTSSSRTSETGLSSSSTNLSIKLDVDFLKIWNSSN